MNKVGFGTRVLNFLIDTTLIFLFAYIAFKVRNWYVFYYHVTHYNIGWFFFSFLFVYYNFCEMIFARTPGKWFSHSKVVNRNGKKPAVLPVLVRTLARLTLIDMFFIPFLDKPLHDYLSGTDVVEV